MNVALTAKFVATFIFVLFIAAIVSAGMGGLKQVSAVLPSGDTGTTTPVWQGGSGR